MGQVNTALGCGTCGPWSQNTLDPSRAGWPPGGGGKASKGRVKFAADEPADEGAGHRLPPLPAPPAISPKVAASPGASQPGGSQSPEPTMMEVFREAAAKRERAAAEEAAALRGQPSSPRSLCKCLAWKRRRPEAAFSDISDAAGWGKEAGSHLGPAVRAVTFGDVRGGGGAKRDIGLVGFYFPDREEPWDSMCGAGFCGNFYHLGPGALELEVRGERRRFCNAEAAFQALKFWDRAEEFETLSGSQAFKRKRELSGKEDFTYAGFGTNWRGMWAVLEAKFRPGSPVAEALLSTGDSFLLEHCPVVGRDAVWSDNCDGEGANWLGLQLMLLRDRLSGRSAWTEHLAGLVDRDSGTPHDKRCQGVWQSHVRSARQALVNAVEEHLSSSAGGGGGGGREQRGRL